MVSPVVVLDAAAPTPVATSAPPDFTVSANPTSLIVPSGFTNTSSIILKSLNGFNGTVQVASPSPLCPSPGCTVWSVSPTSVNLAPNGSANTTLTIFGGAASTTGYATVYGKSGNLSHAVNVTFKVVQSASPDFSMSASPQSLNIPQGSSGTSTITVSSIGGFQGTVNLTPPVTCASLSCFKVAINPTSVTLTPNGSATATLTISTTSTTTTGTYTISVQGTSGSLSHSVSFTFTVVPSPGIPDFTIAANPASLTVSAGATATSSITFASVNNFSGAVTVSTSPPPLCPSPQCTQWSVSPNSVNLVGNGTAKATLTVVAGTQGGPGSVTVYGTSGSLSHSVSVSVTIIFPVSPDFSISADPSSLTVDQGYTVSSAMFLTSYRGFQGNVSLVMSINCSASCPSVTLNPTSLSLNSNGTATSILTVSATTSTAVATYSVTVTATSGSLSHSVTITVTVLDPPGFGGGGRAHFFL